MDFRGGRFLDAREVVSDRISGCVAGLASSWQALPQGLGSMGIEWQDYLEIGAWLN